MRSTILDRENLYFCVSGQRVIKTDCLFIDQDQINLRVRNATRLNDVFYGCLFCQPALDYGVAGFRPDKNIKVAMKAKPDFERLHVNLRFARWRMRTQMSSPADDLGACRARAVHLRRNNNRFAIAADRHRYP